MISLKNLLFQLIILSSVLNLWGQPNYSIGTKWVYNHFGETRTIEVVKDTVIEGKNCQKINGTCVCGIYKPKYIYRENNKLFLYNIIENKFQLLYDFSLTKNHSWKIPDIHYNLDSITIKIDSTGIKNFNGVDFEIQYISYPSKFEFGDFIIKGIGSNNSFYPIYRYCEPKSGPLLCFQNESFALNMEGEGICETNNYSNIDEVFIYPNPFRESFKVELKYTIPLFITIYNSVGKIVLYRKFYNLVNDLTIDTFSLNSGLYIVVLTTNKNRFTKKIIKIN